ncbi:MAG: hypothetical protein NDJ94_00130 [Vicinamibacteria bacterium]|nr:hypothetical protein [Vicinamibacteria bacterium]
MTSRNLIAALVVALVAPAGLGQEPSLAEIAKQEKKRRKAAARAADQPTRTITEEELAKPAGGTFSAPQGAPGEPAPAASPAVGAAPGAAPGATPEKTEEQVRDESQQKWREDIQKARDDVAKYEAQVSQLEAAVGDTTQNVHSASRANRIAALEQAKTQLTQARQRVEDLENAGRQSGYR